MSKLADLGREYYEVDNAIKELNDKVDELEKKAILAGITAANAYLTTYGVPVLPEDIKERIADATVKALGKANKLLQKQLKKTSKAYKKRHKGEEK